MEDRKKVVTTDLEDYTIPAWSGQDKMVLHALRQALYLPTGPKRTVQRYELNKWADRGPKRTPEPPRY